MSNNYRFHLEKYHPGCMLTCPSCGKPKKLSHYIDEEGAIEFPKFVGRCERLDKCGYHYSPKMYFQEFGTSPLTSSWRHRMTMRPRQWDLTQQRQPSLIDPRIMQRSMSHYQINGLYMYLCSVIGQAATAELMARYHVGTARIHGCSTVFWQVDPQGQVRTGKVITYNAMTGHRFKDHAHSITWAHSILRLPNYNLRQCLFGADQLPARPDAVVALVESEKTALIASHYAPQWLWIATGGKSSGFAHDSLMALHNREVIMVPDLLATDDWEQKMGLLKPIARRVEIDRLIEDVATQQERSQGLDIADFLLMGVDPAYLIQ